MVFHVISYKPPPIPTQRFSRNSRLLCTTCRWPPSFASGLPRLLMCFPCRLRTSTRVQPRLSPQMWRVLSMYCHVLLGVLSCEVFLQPATKRCTFKRDFDKRRVSKARDFLYSYFFIGTKISCVVLLVNTARMDMTHLRSLRRSRQRHFEVSKQ